MTDQGTNGTEDILVERPALALVREDHRLVRTLLHTFPRARGARHPVLSEWDDSIVMVDAAHRRSAPHP